MDSQNNIFSARMNELYALIEHHAGLYYDHDSPEIPDSEYDALVRELAELEREHPEISRKDFLTHKVGGRPSELFAKVKHEVPMLSLDNVFDGEELVNFFARIDSDSGFVCEMKIDGLAVSLVYEDGIFVRGATRGDGQVGEDVTENLRVIEAVPKRLRNAPAGRVEVRGEVLMSRERFEAVNRQCEEQGLKTFANPRNAASGTLRQKDPAVTAQRGLDIFLYYLVDAEKFGVRRQNDALEWLKNHGLPVQEVWKYCENLREVQRFIDHWQEGRYTLNYVTDGVVIKLDDITKWAGIGATAHAPRWAVAYKYPPEEARTKLLDVKISVGRTGILTPVAVLEPVRLAGTQVQRATLHNADYIARKDIRIGDTVIVRKAAEIIPEIVSVDKSARTYEVPFRMPDRCPVCGGEVKQEQRSIIKGRREHEGQEQRVITLAALVCQNPLCPAKLRERIRHFASRAAMDIRGIGKVLAYSLVDSGKVKALTDIYRLTREDWKSLGLGDKETQNIMNEVEGAKTRPLSSFIVGLGIPNVERTLAEKLADYFGTIEALETAEKEDLIKVLSPQIDKAVNAVYEFVRNDDNVKRLRNAEQRNKESFTGILVSELEISKAIAQKIASYFEPEDDYVISKTIEAIRQASIEDIADRLGLMKGSKVAHDRACSIFEFYRSEDNINSLTQKIDSDPDKLNGKVRELLEESLCVIPNVTKSSAKSLVASLWPRKTDMLKNASIRDIFNAAAGEFDAVIVNSIYDFFHDELNIRLIDDFKALGLKFAEVTAPHSLNAPISLGQRPVNQQITTTPEDLKGSPAGKVFVFTGTLSSMTRSEAGKRVAALGGQFSNSITLKTNYLVAGDKPGSKLKKAEELGIRILTEQEFLDMINS